MNKININKIFKMKDNGAIQEFDNGFYNKDEITHVIDVLSLNELIGGTRSNGCLINETYIEGFKKRFLELLHTTKYKDYENCNSRQQDVQ